MYGRVLKILRLSGLNEQRELFKATIKKENPKTITASDIGVIAEDFMDVKWSSINTKDEDLLVRE